MREENRVTEYKSIQNIRTGDKGLRSLSETCVALANSQGGIIYIGFEDKSKAVPSGQIVTDDEINKTVTRLRSLCSNVALSNSEILSDKKGDNYFTITVSPSLRSIATTSDGKIYERVGDQCVPVRSEEIITLSEKKGTYQWEIIPTKIRISDVPEENISNFIKDIKGSDRVVDFIKEKDDLEILEHYHLTTESDVLTHLGVLWLGNAQQRGRLSYPITVQYIVFDSLEKKTRKQEWYDNTRNPKDLILDVEKSAIELKYTYEFSEGLFRKEIPHYNPQVLRELLVNAFAHKSFTIHQDITILVYQDRLEISNPGGLPLTVTANNILHKKVRRNPNMIEIMKAFNLMEGEGSGYDLVYELNAMEAKYQPVIESDYGEVKVTQSKEIIDKELLPLLDFVLSNYKLSQKGYTAFGIIAKERKLLSTELTKTLQLTQEDRLRSYVDKLLKDGLIKSSGERKGTYFYINPELIRNSKSNLKTTLKTIQPHALKALIIEDLRIHPNSSAREILGRLSGVKLKDLRRALYAMVDEEISTAGATKNRTYSIKE